MKLLLPDLSIRNYIITIAISLLLLNGCIPMDSYETTKDESHTEATPSTTAEFEPYYPADFGDLLIPGELFWNREKSVTLNTDSFNGGILHFNGRVEVTSLLEFFNNSMKNDGWHAVGSMKSKDVLLVFTKDSSSCMIRITEGGPIGKTSVYIYITKSN